MVHIADLLKYGTQPEVSNTLMHIEYIIAGT